MGTRLPVTNLVKISRRSPPIRASGGTIEVMSSDTSPHHTPGTGRTAAVKPDNTSVTATSGGGGIPMPLILQGFIEAFAAVFTTAAVIVLPLIILWTTGAFADMSLETLGMLGGQIWMGLHGVPLDITTPAPAAAAEALHGRWWYLPWAWLLIPIFTARRAGRRLARATVATHIWKPLVGAIVGFLLFCVGTTQLVSNDVVTVPTTAGTLIPATIFTFGMCWGMIRHYGSLAQALPPGLVARWQAATNSLSTRTLWTLSYLWSVLTTAFIGVLGAFGLAAGLLAVQVVVQWAAITDVYQRLDSGVLGGLVLTLTQILALPNFAAYTLAFTSGAGFYMGAGSLIAPAGSVVGAQPVVPLLGALPTDQTLATLWWVLLVPVVAGIVAGWWFFRQGENHVAEVIQVRIRQPILGTAAATLATGIIIAAASFLLALLPLWLSSGSWAFGKFTEIGPQIWLSALALAGQIAVGAMIGYLLAPLRERPLYRAPVETGHTTEEDFAEVENISCAGSHATDAGQDLDDETEKPASKTPAWLSRLSKNKRTAPSAHDSEDLPDGSAEDSSESVVDPELTPQVGQENHKEPVPVTRSTVAKDRLRATWSKTAKMAKSANVSSITGRFKKTGANKTDEAAQPGEGKDLQATTPANSSSATRPPETSATKAPRTISASRDATEPKPASEPVSAEDTDDAVTAEPGTTSENKSAE